MKAKAGFGRLAIIVDIEREYLSRRRSASQACFNVSSQQPCEHSDNVSSSQTSMTRYFLYYILIHFRTDTWCRELDRETK
jgi:hypothetical protein